MSPLRQKMIDAMLVRGFSPRTHKSYLAAVTGLSRHYQRSPERVSLEEIRAYILPDYPKGSATEPLGLG